jgi:predicted lipoprotein
VRVFALVCALANVSCMRVEVSFRDVGQPDAWSPDAYRAPRPDAALDAYRDDAPSIDANDRDVPPMDAPSMDAPLPTGADATRAVLASIGEHVILASLRDSATAADALVVATERASASGEAADVEAARLAWRDAMAAWQRAEVFQVGPGGLNLYALAGRGLRDQIHSWPLVSFCGMDTDLVEGAYASPDLLRPEPVSSRGLVAIEYGLFQESAANQCAASAVINTSGSWDALGADEVRRRRLVYAHSAAVVVAERVRELRDAWEPSGENFLGTFATAGAGSTVYTTAQSALNGLSDAMFYLYKDVVDYKIGVPAGLYVDCPTDTCPNNVESRWAVASLDFIRINLVAFRDGYLGAPPPRVAPGLDDLLIAMGASDLDLRIRAAFDDAIAALDLVEAPLERAVVDDATDVAELHRATRALADLFRVEVLTLLDLELPNRVEGDND